MLYESLFFGILLWAVGLAALRWPGWWTAAFVVLGLLSAAPYPPVAFLFLAMCAVLCYRPYLRRRPRVAAATALAALLVPFAVSSAWAWQDVRKAATLRAEYPFESIEGRLPDHPRLQPAQALPND